MKVSELMETQVYTCSPETNLETVAMLMWNHDCGSVPVVDEKNRPVGMVTDRDISIGSALNHKALWDLSTQQVTNNRQIFTCSIDEDIQSALATMEKEQVRRLPVVDETGQLKGLLSMRNVISSATPKRNKSSELSYTDVMSTLKGVCSSAETSDTCRGAA